MKQLKAWTKNILYFSLLTFCLFKSAYAIEKRLVLNEFTLNYKFEEIKRTYSERVDLSSLEELSVMTAEKILINSIPNFLREKAEKYAKYILQSSARHQVDPLWVSAVIWTESHFNNNAISPCAAMGLMQVMPETGMHLMKTKFGRKLSKTQQVELLKRPEYNIELGVIYLKDLLKRFDGNYKLATVAYNMGPNWVSRSLSRGFKVGQSHAYHIKVTRAYKNIERSYSAIVARLGNFKSYESALIAMGQTEIDSRLAPLFAEIEKELLGTQDAKSI